MKKLIFKFLLFSIPIILVLLVPTVILRISGENFKQISELSLKQDKYIIGYSNNENNYLYLKWHRVNDGAKSKVLALGSSRVMEFRAGMFDASFYNAGWATKSLDQFQPFLEGIAADKYPEYLIIGLDQWFFNKNTDSFKTTTKREMWKNSFSYYSTAATYRAIYSDLLHRKINRSVLLDKQDSVTRIGLNARINDAGFLNDGGMYYGDEVAKLMHNDTTHYDFRYRATYDRIRKGDRKFEYGSDLNPDALVILERLLVYCNKHHIKVVAFLPPFADEIYKYMEQSGKYTYMSKIYPAIKPLVERYNGELYDFSTVSSVHSSDSEVLDGLHGGELTYLKIVIKMLEEGSVLNKTTNLERLKKDASTPINRYNVYGI